MNITNKDFNAIKTAWELLYENWYSFNEAEQDIIVAAGRAIIENEKKRKANNARTAAYIAEKRKSDKTYARGLTHQPQK